MQDFHGIGPIGRGFRPGTGVMNLVGDAEGLESLWKGDPWGVDVVGEVEGSHLKVEAGLVVLVPELKDYIGKPFDHFDDWFVVNVLFDDEDCGSFFHPDA